MVRRCWRSVLPTSNTWDYIYFKNRHHVFVGASQTLVSVTHPTEHWTDLIGQTDYDVFEESYADKYYALEKKVFAGFPVAHEVQPTLSNDGRAGWVDNRKYPIRDSNGQIIGLFGIARDITELKRTEAALIESEQFLRTILDEIPDPVVIKDAAGNFLLCNSTVARLYNTTPQAMVGKNDGDFGVPPDMAEGFRQNVLDIMARGETQVVFENSRDAASGEIRHYRSIKKPLCDAQGNKQILVVAQDITDVIRAQQKVTESERRLQQVMEITHEGIWDWHVPSGVVVHNPQWYVSLNYRPDELPGNVESFASLIHPEDQAIVRHRLDELLKGRTTDYHSEHRLVRRDGQTIWVQDRGRVVERDALGYPIRVVGSFTDITHQRDYQQHLQYLAHYDTLTGLPNRVLLADRMHQATVQARRREQKLMVAYLDLDGFKAVNDQHGHALGDQLLNALATRFKATLREGDTIARLGGDEFVAVFVDLQEVAASLPLIERLLAVASGPVEIDGALLQVSASIGVSVYPQADDVDADQLLRQADQAMYHAKVAGKNRYHLFDAERDHHLRVRNDQLERIAQALAQDEFVLYYQPKVNLRSGAVIGAEALIRWQHPDQGLLAPNAFLPVIESHALGIALGEWVLETALQQIETWHHQGIDLPVSINMTGQDLQQPQFAARLASRLKLHPGVKPGRLELEVLETSALDDMGLVAGIINACADMGVQFALDDFGTGYSSLTYLKRLPAQTLKIDQSFVRDMLDDPADLAIVQGVLGLAAAFKRQAIAEGAETQAHCQALLDIGCELAQGYGIARPMPAHAMADWIAQSVGRISDG